MLLAYSDELPNYLRTGGIVGTQALQDKKDLLTAALLAHVRGARHALDSKADAVGWAVEKAGTKEDVASWADAQYKRLKLVNPDFAMTPEAINFTQDTDLLVGMQKAKFDVAKALDSSIQEAIIKQLSPYKWA